MDRVADIGRGKGASALQLAGERRAAVEPFAVTNPQDIHPVPRAQP
ncbi:hypothetical protein [Synechococcus sp. Cu2B8-bc1011]